MKAEQRQQIISQLNGKRLSNPPFLSSRERDYLEA
jgi:hypothetical protein